MKKSTLILILILIMAAIPRLWQLGKIPVSMSDDEVRLVYTAYSLFKTGKDINGQVFPLAFPIYGYAFNPVPIYLTSPFVGLLGLNMFTSRLPFALSGALSIPLVYLIAYQLLKKRTIAVLASFVLTFSAWHLQISRFAYEAGFALFFYLLGTFIFLLIKRNHFIFTILAMVVFLFAFYSYSGTKLIFLPLIAVLAWYKLKELNYRQLILILLFSFFTFASFVYLSKTQNAASYGGGQFFFQDIQAAAQAVELERRASSAPELLKRLYHNKLTYWSKIFLDHYQYTFSPQYLFTSQEGSGIFSLWFRGQMYPIEAPLLLLGILYLFHRRRKELWLLFSLLILAALPAGLGPEPTTYTLRSSFMLPSLSILVGSGIYFLSCSIKTVSIKWAVLTLLLFAYFYLLGGYFTQYYFEWPRYGAKYYSKASQDLSLLVGQEKDSKKEIIIDSASSMTFLHFAFYNKLSPTLVQELYNRTPIVFRNVIFQNTCLKIKNDPRKKIPENSLYIIPIECPGAAQRENYSRIIKSPEGLTEWLIFEN